MSVEAFILAGGRSSRFGSDKALIELDGRPLIETIASVVNEALPATNIRIVASSDTQILKWPFSFPTIFDLYPGRGPWSGLHAALAYSQCDWVLAIACDYPFLTAELIENLFARMGDDVDAVVPIQDDGRPQPLCAFYRRNTCLASVEDIVISNRITPPLRTIFEKVRVCKVPFEELRSLVGSDRFFTNINTAAELRDSS